MRFAFLLSLVILTGCGPHRLDDPQVTSEALAREVLSALANGDEGRLRALAITESEFEQRVWPGLPAARPERNLPWSYVWMDLRQKSDTSLKLTLLEHGRKRYVLQSVKFGGETTDHGTYRVHRETVLVVRDSGGQAIELRIFGSMIEADDGWKVFSYVVDQ